MTTTRRVAPRVRLSTHRWVRGGDHRLLSVPCCNGKHDKDSDEGRALRALREIRVRAAPRWDEEEVTLMLWFIKDADTPAPGQQGWDHYLEKWLDRIPAKGRFVGVEGVVQTLDGLSARDYVESDPLDLDHLSRTEED